MTRIERGLQAVFAYLVRVPKALASLAVIYLRQRHVFEFELHRHRDDRGGGAVDPRVVFQVAAFGEFVEVSEADFVFGLQRRFETGVVERLAVFADERCDVLKDPAAVDVEAASLLSTASRMDFPRGPDSS